jgi:hypothetical protein
MLGFTKVSALRLTLPCSGRLQRRLVAVLSNNCRQAIMYHMNYDIFLTGEAKKKRGRRLSLSTSTFQRESTDVPASNSQEIPAFTTRTRLAAFHLEELMKKDDGSFEYPKYYHAAYDWLSEIVGDGNASSKAINLLVHLLLRVVREYSHYLALHVKEIHINNNSSKNEPLWFCNPVVISSVFNRWRDVLSPRLLVQKLQNMSVLLPEHFRYDISTMNIILHVIIRKEPLHRAPLVAENLFDFIAAESMTRTVRGDYSMQPSVHTYSLVLHAWSQSRVSNAAAKMEAIMANLHKEYCASPRPISSSEILPYSIWIRYWSNIGNAEKVDAILAMLDGNEHLRAKVGTTILSHVIFCHTKAGQIRKAEIMYDRMMSLETPTTWTASSADMTDVFDDDEIKGLMLGSFYLINYYRQAIVSINNLRIIPDSCKVQIHQYTDRAEAVLRQVEEFREIDPKSVGKLRLRYPSSSRNSFFVNHFPYFFCNSCCQIKCEKH